MQPAPITDFHTHAFPDELAHRAIPALSAEGSINAWTDGTIDGLLASMDEAGIDRSVVCSIATKPSQFEAILNWSLAIRSDRIVPLPSVHPADDDVKGKVRRVAEAGLRGLKIHPFYQDCDLDSKRMFPLYEAIVEHGLLLVCHTGFDIAFPGVERAAPERVARVVEHFPELPMVVTHTGGWEDWDEVERHLLGRPIWMEVSMTLEYAEAERTRRMLLAHPADRLLFGSDSPWSAQPAMVEGFRALDLGAALEERLFRANAATLLDAADA